MRRAGAAGAALALVVAVLACGAGAGAARAQSGSGELHPIPPLARVVDEIGLLTAAQHAALDQKLAAFETAHGAQAAVVIVASTQPEPIEVFGNRLGESWKLGRKGIGDGLILIVARDDKRVRIEVARALEGAVPDVIASRIIREDLAPSFARNDFYGGIDAALTRLFGLVEGEQMPPPKASARARDGGLGLDVLAPLFIGALFVGSLLRGLFGRSGAVIAGGGAAGAAWLLFGLSTLASLGIGAVVAFIVLSMGAGWRGGGFPIVLGGGGFGGRGGGGGGFSSGGGGDFSGGGASGSW